MFKNFYMILFIILVGVFFTCLYLFFYNDRNCVDDIGTKQVVQNNIKTQNKIVEEYTVDIEHSQNVKFKNKNIFVMLIIFFILFYL